MSNITKLCIAGVFIFLTSASRGQVSVGISISANIPPPALPVYSQPPCPTDGYLWSPGYWGYANGEYFWVPGVWVMPPQPGFLWTPAYWGYNGGVYGFHAGYWGTHIGFYGGVNYGYGYNGSGFGGGRWEGNSFRYNTAVVNVNRTVIHNTYTDKTVIVNNTTINNRTSYNGGPKGATARPTPQEQHAAGENHVQATREQTIHMQQASTNRAQFASVNHGNPSTMAVARPGTRPDHAPIPTTSNGQNNVRPSSPNRPANSHVAVHRPTVQNSKRPAMNQQNHAAQAQHPVMQQHNPPAQQNAMPQHQNRPEQHNAAPRQHAEASHEQHRDH